MRWRFRRIRPASNVSLGLVCWMPLLAAWLIIAGRL